MLQLKAPGHNRVRVRQQHQSHYSVAVDWDTTQKHQKQPLSEQSGLYVATGINSAASQLAGQQLWDSIMDRPDHATPQVTNSWLVMPGPHQGDSPPGLVGANVLVLIGTSTDQIDPGRRFLYA
jgi:hypothetical protein